MKLYWIHFYGVRDSYELRPRGSKQIYAVVEPSGINGEGPWTLTMDAQRLTVVSNIHSPQTRLRLMALARAILLCEAHGLTVMNNFKA